MKTSAIDKRTTIVEGFGVPSAVFDYLDTEARKLAYDDIYVVWDCGYWPDFVWCGVSCLIRCETRSFSFQISDGVLSIGNEADPIYRGPVTLESAQTAMMILKMMEAMSGRGLDR